MYHSFWHFALVLWSLPAAACLAGFAAKPNKAGFGKTKADVASNGFQGKKTFEKHMKQWGILQEARELDACDVYVTAEESDKFWFVGKSGARSSAGADAAARSVVVQKRLVLEHSKLLQRELKTSKSLTMWCAPPNSEVQVARRMQGLSPLDGMRPRDMDLAPEDCGFMPEQYEKPNGEREKGFYVKLGADGQPRDGDESGVRFVSPEKFEEMQQNGEIG